MSKVAVTHDALLDALRCLAKGSHCDEQLSEQFCTAILAFGSETPDNVRCMKNVAVSRVDEVCALRLQNSKISLSNVAHELEEVSMPSALRAAFPDMSEAEWSAFLRLTTLIYIALEPL